MSNNQVTMNRRALKLVTEGAVALAHVEGAGVRVDMGYLDTQLAATAAEITANEAALQRSEEWGVWKKRYGPAANLGSREQLGEVLFNALGYPCTVRTAPSAKYPDGRPSTDEDVLADLNIPFLKSYLEQEKLKKARGTYLVGIKNEAVQHNDGCWYVHPSYNLHTVRSMRSSCNMPNFQNIPNRNARFAEMVRRAYIPRKGRHLVEVDLSAAEVCGCACFSRDANLIRYIKTGADMHLDLTKKAFLLDAGDKKSLKVPRDIVKNQFTFPEFYGSWYVNCAKGIWDLMVQRDARTHDGRSLPEHLASKGIMRLGEGRDALPGTFIHHLGKVERWFWDECFPDYKRHLERWCAAYERTGEFQMATGFTCRGVYSRNELLNFPVQGPVFHILLYGLTLMVKWLLRNTMASVVVGEIHDSFLGDVPPNELDDYLATAKAVLTEVVPKAWADWICVPLAVECDVTPVGGSWFEKKGVVV